MSPRGEPQISYNELLAALGEFPAIVWACDRDLRFTFGGGAALHALGLRANELLGVPLGEYLGDGPEAARVLDAVQRALQGESSAMDVEWSGIPYESHVTPLRDSSGEVVGAFGLALDISDRRAIEDELFISRFRLAQTSALFPVAHYTIDPSGTLQLTDEHRRMLGLPLGTTTLTQEALLDLVHPDDRQNVIDARRLALAKREPYTFDCRIIRPDGGVRYLRFHASYVYDPSGHAMRTIGTATDVTEEVERIKAVAELLSHDGITGLPNRAHFTDRLRHDLAFAQGSAELMALVLLDLDRFSRVNDSLGHPAGDAYLRTIASRLRSFNEGASDVAARIGGDEFAVLLRGAQRRGDLVRRIEALRSLIEEPVSIDGHDLHVGVSIGVGIYPHDADDQTLLQKADVALSRARSAGMGRTEYYDLMLGEDVESSFKLEHGLHAAIRASQLTPYYQPIVDASSRIRGVEALARWNHPEYGLLAPKAFLDVAEESGLIVEMGESLMLQSCAGAVQMRKRSPDLRLNVNLSSRHLLSPHMAALIGSALAATGLPGSALQIEVTEQSLIADVSAGRRAIDSLRDLGASVVIDDFGTGYNTLTYLKSYQVDGIKLDRAFVRDMLADRYSRAICEGVMAMARSLDLHVIAEGIESRAQRAAAIAMGCEELQGYLFGRPMTEARMEALLNAQ